jgi:hypothetical protein
MTDNRPFAPPYPESLPRPSKTELPRGPRQDFDEPNASRLCVWIDMLFERVEHLKDQLESERAHNRNEWARYNEQLHELKERLTLAENNISFRP